MRPRHLYTLWSFIALIGIYRYLMRRFILPDLPLVFLGVALGFYASMVCRDWFYRPKIEGMTGANPKRTRVIDV